MFSRLSSVSYRDQSFFSVSLFPHISCFHWIHLHVYVTPASSWATWRCPDQRAHHPETLHRTAGRPLLRWFIIPRRLSGSQSLVDAQGGRRPDAAVASTPLWRRRLIAGVHHGGDRARTGVSRDAQGPHRWLDSAHYLLCREVFGEWFVIFDFDPDYSVNDLSGCWFFFKQSYLSTR